MSDIRFLDEWSYWWGEKEMDKDYEPDKDDEEEVKMEIKVK